jgi:hypothetical protein
MVMALIMIDPASSWFEIAELPVITQLQRQIVIGKAADSQQDFWQNLGSHSKICKLNLVV